MKIKRQTKIIELIENNEIGTQEELMAMLDTSGLKVTQATVSRDIKELKLSKVSMKNGRQKYVMLAEVSVDFNERLVKIFRTGVISMDHAQNVVVLKTLEGMAQAVGACIDALNKTEILGSVAGDDTIICILRTEHDAVDIIAKFKEIINTG